MSKSIMHVKGNDCYLCNLIGDSRRWHKYLEEHHCFEGSNRSLSEHYGLKVYLCLEHHREGRDAVHINANVARVIHEDAQRAFEAAHPDKDFLTLFHINYL